MKYKVWKVFGENERITYYVINTATRKVQSVWLGYMQAQTVCRDLNRGLIPDDMRA